MISLTKAMKNLKFCMTEVMSTFDEESSPLIGTNIFGDKEGNLYNLPEDLITLPNDVNQKKFKPKQKERKGGRP